MRAVALRYALAPACVLLAVLLHLSPAGATLHPTGLFAIAVLAAAWHGGAGPGFLAAVLATFTLPEIIALSYPLLGGFLDLPHFVTFSIVGLAVGWGSSRRGSKLREQGRSELALRQSEERYELAMAASESGYWDWHLPSNRYFTSPRAFELAGYPPGTTWVDRDEYRAKINMHPEDFARYEAAREALFAGTGERLSMEVRYIVRGETRWFILHAICKRDDTGKVVRWTGSSTDVTERKRAGEELEAMERKLLQGRLEERYMERERIARELHDTLLQGFQGLVLTIGATIRRVAPGEPRDTLETALDRAQGTLSEGRDRVLDLRKAVGFHGDLSAAFENAAADLAIANPATFALSERGTRCDLNPVGAEEVLLIAREALANAYRHAGAQNIEAEIEYDPSQLRVRIRDDGKGVTGEVIERGVPGHWGMTGMRERAEKLGASLFIRSGAGSGTEVELEVPSNVAYVRSRPDCDTPSEQDVVLPRSLR